MAKKQLRPTLHKTLASTLSFAVTTSETLHVCLERNMAAETKISQIFIIVKAKNTRELPTLG